MRGSSKAPSPSRASSCCSARRAAVVQPVDRALGAAHLLGDLRRREADDVAHDHHAPLLLGQRRREPRAGPRARSRSASSACVSAPRTSSVGIGRRRRRWSSGDVAREPQQPARERDAAIGVLDDHRHQLHEDLLGEVLGLLLVPHDAAHVAVDVVRVAHVQETDRVAVPLLGACDRELHFAPDGRGLLQARACTEAHLSILDGEADHSNTPNGSSRGRPPAAPRAT